MYTFILMDRCAAIREGVTAVSPANLRLYTSEGELTGLLTWHHREEGRWDVAPALYSPTDSDDQRRRLTCPLNGT